jgi:hypothetical protein
LIQLKIADLETCFKTAAKKQKPAFLQLLNGKQSNVRHDFMENGRAARVACHLSHTPASKITGNLRGFPMPLIQKPSQSGRRKVNCGIVFGTVT